MKIVRKLNKCRSAPKMLLFNSLGALQNFYYFNFSISSFDRPVNFIISSTL